MIHRAGTAEGDGSFIVSKDKVYFDITQSMEDIQVLYYIKKELGFGKVMIRSEINRKVGVFYVSSQENFTKLMVIFNGNLSPPPLLPPLRGGSRRGEGNYKKEQFRRWLDAYNKQYNMNIAFIDRLVKPSLSSGWISGPARQMLKVVFMVELKVVEHLSLEELHI